MFDRYLTKCPVDTHTELLKTNILLPEGVLLKCKICKQLISQCTEKTYLASMLEFNDPIGTLPKLQSLNRAFKLHAGRLKQFINILKRPANKIKLLDVGCSSGAFLNSATRLGFVAEGVEPARKAVDTAVKNGLNVKCGTLEAVQYNEQCFDVVTLFEVIEHLKDPVSLLKEIHRILKKNGILMIGTGNANSWTARILQSRWEYFSIKNHGGHISFFNPYSIKLLAEKTNFSCKNIITKNLKLSEKDNGNKIIYRMFKIISQMLNPIARLFNQGHDMIVILEKK